VTMNQYHDLSVMNRIQDLTGGVDAAARIKAPVDAAARIHSSVVGPIMMLKHIPAARVQRFIGPHAHEAPRRESHVAGRLSHLI
jgi:hypothetical protein